MNGVVKMAKSNNLDMTNGDALKLLVAFTLPAVASNLLNQVYSITDSLIVGRTLGETLLAAIGVCMPVILLISSMVIGLNVGVGILLSQCFGGRDEARMRHTFANSIYMGIFLGVVIAILGVFITDPILALMKTPQGPFPEASAYMKITFGVTILPIFYFMFSNIFRGMGDSYTPLYVLIISVISNVALDYLFVVIFRWGVAGSAWATAIAQALSVLFAIVMLYIKYPQMRLKREDFAVDLPLFGNITKLAIPIAIQSGFNNLGNVIVQGCINGFGETVMAAYTLGSRLGSFSLMPVETIGGSVSVYAGQNYGAKKMDRIEQGVKACHVMNVVTSIVLGLVIVFLGKPMTGVFLENPSEEIVRISYMYLLYAAVPGIIYGVMNIYQQVLRGFGRANQSLIGSFMQLGTKVAVALLGAFVYHNIIIVWLAWPLSYIAGTIVPYVDYKLYMKKQK